MGQDEEVQLSHEFILVCFNCTVVIYESLLGFGKYMLRYLGVMRHHVCNLQMVQKKIIYKCTLHLYIFFYSKNKA